VQWEPILEWLEPVVSPPVAANDSGPARPPAARVAGSRPGNLMPAQDSLVHGSRLMTTLQRSAAQHRAPAATLAGSRTSVPHLLKR
jgi:chromosome partitioning protein